MAERPAAILLYDLFKLGVLLMLLALLIFLLWRNPLQPAAVPSPQATEIARTGTATPPTPTQTPNSTPTPSLAVPTASATSPAPAGSTAPPSVATPILDVRLSAERPLTLSGASTPGATIQILIDDQVVGTTTTGEDGQWTFTTEVAPGDHDLGVNALDANGAVVASSPLLQIAVAAAPTPTPMPIQVDFSCVGQPSVDLGDRYVVGICDTLTKISQRTGVSLAALIAANPQIENPDLIFPGQVIVIPR
ncbi:MAG: LysM peptidoglycan-binding domain-containing protein [Anaerolineales bacterium]